MVSTECSICKTTYNKNENKPMFLECNDILCLKCVKHLEESYKDKDGKFKCEQCCNMTKSSGIVFKNAYPKDDASNTPAKKLVPAQGEFEVFVKLLSGERISVRVTKDMTVMQLKKKIVEVKRMNIGGLFLNFKKPLNNNQKLEYYNINKTVTISQSTYEAGGC